jgi:uncharacterized protein involved in tolerance to divalent cations
MLDVKSQDISIPDTVVVLCTAPDEATAQDLAAKVLAEKLAACVTPTRCDLLYYWEGKLEQEYEVQMILKTTVTHQQAPRLPEVIIRIKRLNFWFYPSLTETLITSHGSTHPYADPAAVQHIYLCRII